MDYNSITQNVFWETYLWRIKLHSIKRITCLFILPNYYVPTQVPTCVFPFQITKEGIIYAAEYYRPKVRKSLDPFKNKWVCPRYLKSNWYLQRASSSVTASFVQVFIFSFHDKICNIKIHTWPIIWNLPLSLVASNVNSSHYLLESIRNPLVSSNYIFFKLPYTINICCHNNIQLNKTWQNFQKMCKLKFLWNP